MGENESLKNNSNEGKPVDNSTPPVDKSPSKQGSKVIPPKKKPKKKGRGGARPGAGRPKGKMEPRTLEKMAVKKKVEERIAARAEDLLNAHLTVALGVQYVFTRRLVKTKKGPRWSKFERVLDPDEIRKFLDGEFDKAKTQFYMITAEKPDVHAIDSLLDRSFGKAPQNLNIKDDRPDPIASILKKFGLLDDEGESDAGQTKETS